MSIAEKYNAALKLAQSGRYQEALTMIEGVDHAKVNALRDKIEARLPAPDATPAKKRTPRYRRYTLTLLIVLSIGVLVFLLVIGIQANKNMSAAGKRGVMWVKVFNVCLDIYSSTDYDCHDGTDTAMTLYADEIEVCFDQSKEADLEQEFIRCLADQGVKI